MGPDAIRDPRAWLYTIGSRLAFNEVRRRRRWMMGPLGDDRRAAPMVSDIDLWDALAELDRKERAALVMQVLEGYTHAEIADRLGIPAGTASSLLSRGKAKLRQRLGTEVERDGHI